MSNKYRFYTKQELIQGKYNKERNIVQEVQDELIISNLLDITGYAPVMCNYRDIMPYLNISNSDIMRDRVAEANREFVELIVKSEIPSLIELINDEKKDGPGDNTIYVSTEGIVDEETKDTKK